MRRPSRFHAIALRVAGVPPRLLRGQRSVLGAGPPSSAVLETSGTEGRARSRAAHPPASKLTGVSKRGKDGAVSGSERAAPNAEDRDRSAQLRIPGVSGVYPAAIRRRDDRAYSGLSFSPYSCVSTTRCCLLRRRRRRWSPGVSWGAVVSDAGASGGRTTWDPNGEARHARGENEVLQR